MRTSGLILLLAATLACPATAQDRIFVQVPALMDPGARIDPDVRVQCDLPAMVGLQVLAKIQERSPGAMTLDPSAPGSTRFIRVRIFSATTMPGVGIRQIAAIAEVVEGDRVVASARFNDRTSVTPGFGMPLCDVMDYIASGIGKRVAAWAEKSYPRATPASVKQQ